MFRLLIFLFALTATMPSFAEEDTFGQTKAPHTLFPGEYIGTYLGDKKEIKYGLQIFALGDGVFRAIGYNGGLPGDGFQKGGKIERVEGKLISNSKDTAVILFQNGKEEAKATFKQGILVGQEDDKIIARLKKIERAHPITETD